MSSQSRRTFLSGVGLGLAAALSAPQLARAADKAEIDAAVARALQELRTTVSGAEDLISRSQGYLIMADVRKAGFVIGGEYGEGTLFVGNAPVDYYSVAAASFGLQAGIQRSHQVLFFLTEPALRQFRTDDGWTAGAEVEVALPDNGIGANVDTVTANRPVIGFIFGREGLLAGASLDGAKYSRIYR